MYVVLENVVFRGSLVGRLVEMWLRRGGVVSINKSNSKICYEEYIGV